MSQLILNEFAKELHIDISRSHVKSLHTMRQVFETRQDHALTLNSQLIGVFPIAFTANDRDEFFDIFGVARSELVTLIGRIPSIDKSRKVASDPMNVLVTWLLHLASISRKLTSRDREQFMLDLAVIWHYKFFTSLINYAFKHGANREIMQATINDLSNKYDIIKYGTWRSVIEMRSLDLIGPKSIHLRTIRQYADDKKILYIISDTQTRIRDKVKNIVNEYYATKEKGDAITSYGSVGEIDGEKVLASQLSTFDTMTNNLTIELTNVYTFVDDRLVEVITSLFRNLKPDYLKFILGKYSELAVVQTKTGELDQSKRVKGQELYTGSRALLLNIVQKSYRFCIKTDTNLKSKPGILNKIKNLYSSSRIKDPEIAKVKDSVAYFIDTYGSTKREATNSSLRIAFILYIIAKSFKYL